MKKNIIIVIFLFTIILLCAQAPEWAWAVSAGGESRDHAYDMAIDQDNNLYVVGFFYSIVADFGDFSLVNVSLPDSLEPELQFMNDIFIAKLDNEGNWLWARRAGGSYFDHGSSIAADTYGNVYVTGAFADFTSFGNTTLYSQYSSVFVSKLDTNGNWCWTVQANGTGYSKGADIAIDNNNSIYVTGTYWDNIEFADITLTSTGDSDVFIAKLDNNGNWDSALNISLSNVYWEYEFRLATDTDNNLYLTGMFSDTVTFGSTALTSIGDNDVFIAKMDSNGFWLWAKQAGGAWSDSGYGITTDSDNNVLVTGYFSDSATFGSTVLNSNGQIDIFISKLDNNGNWLWTKRAGGDESYWESGWGITADQENNIYFTGDFSGNADFGTSNLFNNEVMGIFLAKLDADGNWLWAKQAGQTYGFGVGIVIDNNNNIYHTGAFYYGADFGDIILTGEDDIFVAKLSPPLVHILSPNGAEVWRSSTSKTVYWSSNYTGNLDILFSYNNGTSWSYLNSTPVSASEGQFSFTVPAIPSSQCLVKIASTEYPNSLFDVSDNTFTITTTTPASVTLLSPDSAGLKLQSGRICNISWQPYLVDYVNLDVSFDMGQNWHSIVTELPSAQGNYDWLVPDSLYTNCYLRVSSSIEPSNYDWSNHAFAIAKLELTNPMGGEEILLGSPITITWQKGNLENVKLEYSNNNGTDWIIINSSYPALNQYYDWIAPMGLGDQFLLRISDADYPAIFDQVESPFAVCSLTFNLPQGTYKLQENTVFTITWMADYVSSQLRLEYTVDQENFILIAENLLPTTGTYDWLVPDLNMVNGKFRISSMNFPSVHDTLGFFTISKLILTSPNGGEIWPTGFQREITWTQYNTDNVDLEFSADNGTSWQNIAMGISADSGSYQWTLPCIDSSITKVRITDSDFNHISDQSDDFFTIIPPIKILTPNGGEYMTANTLYTIEWMAEPDVSNVLIDYSLNGGSSWLPIFSTPYSAAAGQYEWIVPNVLTSEALIKVRNALNSEVYDLSDSTFTIVDVVIAPTAEFTADLTSGLEPLTVQFTDLSEAGSGYITSWLWDFGDGEESTEQNPLHTYVNHGLYSVSLTVTNVFDSTGTIVKTDFINVIPRLPLIEILSDSPVNFGFVYLGSQSESQSVWISNAGTAPLIVDSISFYQGIHFENDNTEFPIIVNEGDSTFISLIFTPVSAGTLSDSLYIHNNSQNQPTASIKLSGTSAYVPPKPPENVSVVISSSDAIISWDAVTETIFDTPIVPDGYIVLYNETPYEDEQFYYYLGYTTNELNYTHLGVALFRSQMFYKVIAFVNYDRAILTRLDELNRTGTKVRYKDLLKK